MVWRALTEPALLSQWLLPIAELELSPGATFLFQAEPQPGWDGRVNGRLVEVEPPSRLVYAWVVGDLDTLVTFTLTPTATGTHLAMQQTGFKPEQGRNLAGARYGWNMMSGRLVEVLARLAA